MVGCHDDQYAFGLEDDYAATGNNGRDGFENWLVTKLHQEIGAPAITSCAQISFEEIDGLDVCRVDVAPADRPVYVGDDALFYVRTGNSTRPFNPKEANEYVGTRW